MVVTDVAHKLDRHSEPRVAFFRDDRNGFEGGVQLEPNDRVDAVI